MNPYQPPPTPAIEGQVSPYVNIRVAIFSFIVGAVASIIDSTNRVYSKPIYTPYAIDSTSGVAILCSIVLGVFVRAILIGSLAMITATWLHRVSAVRKAKRGRESKEKKNGSGRSGLFNRFSK